MIDTQYEDLLRDVMSNGKVKSDRTGTGTKSVFHRTLRYDLSEGFPLITSKKMFTRGMIAELLWFISGDTKVSTLQDQGVNFWNEWVLDDGTIGPGYGYQLRSWPDYDGGSIDQFSELLNGLKTNPDSRRHILTFWNVAQLSEMALPPCHGVLTQFYVADGKLSCAMTQRSADVFLGLPVNIASYALLTHIVAKECGLEPGEFIWTGNDVHIYLNHFDAVSEQLEQPVHEFPELVIKNDKGVFDYEVTDFEITGYEHGPVIKAPVAV